MGRTTFTAILLLTAAALLPVSAFALTLETPPANSDTMKFADPGKKWEPFDYRNLSNRGGDNTAGDSQSRGLTFGSPNSGPGSFSFSVGPVQNNNPFDNSRFFRLGPPPTGPNQ